MRARLARLRHLRPEVWVRQDVGGHALGCRMLPTQVGDHGPGAVACDCYASVWKRWRR